MFHHYDAFCFSLNVSKLQPSVRLFLIYYCYYYYEPEESLGICGQIKRERMIVVKTHVWEAAECSMY
jgi:hypothetical protein